MELSLNLVDVPLLLVVAVDELNVVLRLLCLPNTPYHALRVLGNLVGKGSYHVVLFAHDIVFCRIAVTLYFVFYYTLLLFGVVDAAVLRIVELLRQLLDLEDIERVGRLEGKSPVRQYNAVLAKFYG